MNPDPEKRKRLLLILAAVAVILLVGDSLVFTPLVKNWQARSAEIAKLRKDVREGRSLIERGPRLETQWKEMQTQSLPRDPAQAEQDLISAFDRWGRASSVELASIKPQWKRGANDRYSLLECRVDANGSLAALARFVHEVEKSPLALRVETVELGARDNNGQKLGLGLVVTGLRLAPLEKK
jgi:Tfp pilus assembly protein PilO